MIRKIVYCILPVLVYSCSVIEQSSKHDFENGHYRMIRRDHETIPVYLTMDSGMMAVHTISADKVNTTATLKIDFNPGDSLCHYPLKFYRNSLDIDITTILMKYRFASKLLPQQLNTDFNGAIYAGWRHDWFQIKGKSDPLGVCRYNLRQRGFDFGLLGGITSVQMSPFTTGGIGTREYNAPALQYGFAVFAESNMASFGLATGFDYLLGSERNIWLYRNKPWVGFVVGLALN
jgi:hypothetical protein